MRIEDALYPDIYSLTSAVFIKYFILDYGRGKKVKGSANGLTNSDELSFIILRILSSVSWTKLMELSNKIENVRLVTNVLPCFKLQFSARLCTTIQS